MLSIKSIFGSMQGLDRFSDVDQYLGRIPRSEIRNPPVAMSNERLIEMFTPCNGISVYHNLSCGHRVEGPWDSLECSVNCKRAARGAPYACPDCTADDVRLEIQLQGLNIETDDNRADRVRNIHKLSDKRIQVLQRRGYKICRISIPFKDPMMQFWSNFAMQVSGDDLVEDQDTILGDLTPQWKPPKPTKNSVTNWHAKNLDRPQPKKDTRIKLKDRDAEAKDGAKNEETAGEDASVTTTHEEKKKDAKISPEIEYANQRMAELRKQDKQEAIQRARLAAKHVDIDAVLEQMGDLKIGLKIEDDTTKAVREAFSRCSLSK